MLRRKKGSGCLHVDMQTHDMEEERHVYNSGAGKPGQTV